MWVRILDAAPSMGSRAHVYHFLAVFVTARCTFTTGSYDPIHCSTGNLTSETAKPAQL